MKKDIKYYDKLAKEYYALSEKISDAWDRELKGMKEKVSEEVESEMNNSKSIRYKILRRFYPQYYRRIVITNQINKIDEGMKDFEKGFSVAYDGEITKKNKIKMELNKISYPLTGDMLSAQGLVNFIKFVAKRGGRK